MRGCPGVCHTDHREGARLGKWGWARMSLSLGPLGPTVVRRQGIPRSGCINMVSLASEIVVQIPRPGTAQSTNDCSTPNRIGSTNLLQHSYLGEHVQLAGLLHPEVGDLHLRVTSEATGITHVGPSYRYTSSAGRGMLQLPPPGTPLHGPTPTPSSVFPPHGTPSHLVPCDLEPVLTIEAPVDPFACASTQQQRVLRTEHDTEVGCQIVHHKNTVLAQAPTRT